MLHGTGQIRGYARIIARMITRYRINVQQTQSLAHFANRYERFVQRFAIQTPFDADGIVSDNHVARDRGRFTEVGGLIAKCEWRYFWRN